MLPEKQIFLCLKRKVVVWLNPYLQAVIWQEKIVCQHIGLCMGIWNMKKYEAHISDDNSLLSQIVEKRPPLLWKSYLKAAFIIKLDKGDPNKDT